MHGTSVHAASDITAGLSLWVFGQRLMTCLFWRSYPGMVWNYLAPPVGVYTPIKILTFLNEKVARGVVVKTNIGHGKNCYSCITLIAFHQYTVNCDILRPTKLNVYKKQQKHLFLRF